MYRTLLAIEPPLTGDELRHDLDDAGIDVVAESDDAADLATAAVRHAADLVVAASASPSTLMFEAARMLGTLAPCPFVLFTSDRDTAKIERASASGVHAYVVDGYAKHRLLSVIQVARARFRHERLLKEELVGLLQRFEERKLVDRAKGALMRSRGVTEDEAFEMLRKLAMSTRQRIGVVSQSVIDMSRAGEAVNRAGQLRMLSQRLVLCYAQILVGHDPSAATQITADCIHRVEANLEILRKAISTSGYGERVDRVAASWREVRTLCAEPPEVARLASLDARAETMLVDAEALTEFLEAAGLVASLHVINVAGRQRMLGQRIAKLCFMLALAPTPAQLAQLRELSGSFQSALDQLQRLPLSSESICHDLDIAVDEWQRLRSAIESIADATALGRIRAASERLLDASERLTDQYEQAMQTLIGDRLGRLR
jgi:AmiR/NasT family two-component response regulator